MISLNVLLGLISCFCFWMFFSALRLGLPFVPSYLGHVGAVEDMIQGVNYASASAGVIFTSGSELVLLFFH